MKILIVDDDRLVTASLKMIVEADGMTVLGMGHSGREALSLFETLQPDILLMDIRMEGMTGLEAGEIILGRYPQAKLLFLTTFADDDYIIKALKIGAKGYLLKQNYESIVPALKAISAGQSVFGEDVVAKLPAFIAGTRQAKVDLTRYSLTDKEQEIVALIAEGLSNKEIARALFLSEGTVRNSISTILDKLQLRGRTQLAIFYYKQC